MVRTPWGNSGSLRARMLPPGRGTPREQVLANQRERLFGALVAAVAERGYEATRVEDLVEFTGVSRKAFYEQFASKQDCFVAAIRALVEAGMAIMLAGYDSAGPWEARVERGLEALMRLLVAQPAAARLCFVEAYAAGPVAVEAVERAFSDFEDVVGGALDDVPGRAGTPPQIVRALVGGLRKVIHTRLHRGRESELVDLVPQIHSWGLSYYPPPVPLQRPGTRRTRGGAPGGDGGGGRAGADDAERILRALAATASERGYAETTVGEIARRAGVSLSTFYSYFPGKEEAMLAALDSGAAQMMAAMLPAYRRAPDWPHAVRAAMGATFAFGAAEPAYTRLGAVEVYAAGARALEQRDEVIEGLQGLVAPGYELAPDASPLAAEAIAGAVYALIHDQVHARGPQSLPEIAPLASYVVLCPFLGPEKACEVANGDGRRR